MMKGRIVFCFYTSDHEVSFGIGFLSSALKQAGFDTGLAIYREMPGKQMDTTENVVLRILEKEPFIVAFSVMTSNWHKIKNVISLLKKEYDGFILVGGYHAVLSPEEVFSHQGVDAVCLGEGEQPIIELVQWLATDRKKAFPLIKGLIFKGQHISSESLKNRWLVERLEDYPYFDYDIFDSDGSLRQKHLGAMTPAGIFSLPVITGRGCPYRCTYCNNSTLLDLYGGTKRFVRRYSPNVVVKNIKTIFLKWRPQFFEFFDETFTLNRVWIKDFCRQYRAEVAIPFLVMSRIDLIDEPTVSLLAESGMKVLFFGLECGDESYRMKYLKRTMTDNAIKEGTRLLRKYDIMVGTFNILGMPFETRDTIKKTFELNEEIEPDAAVPSIYQPLPGSELARIAYENNMISHPAENGWDYCSPSLDTYELPSSYVIEMLEKFREKYTYQNMQNIYSRLRRIVNHPE